MKKILEKLVPKKKAAKKEVEVIEEAVCDPKFNEFGTCIACQGGKTECLHNNLTTVGRTLVCVTCGMTVK